MQSKLQPPLNPIALQQYLLYLANQQQLQRFVQAQIQYRFSLTFNARTSRYFDALLFIQT